MLKVGDTGYIIRYNKTIEKNIIYYIDSVRICYIDNYRDLYYVDHNFNSESGLNERTRKRLYKSHRLYEDYNSALLQCELKNKETVLKKEYKAKIKELYNE